MIKSKIGVLIDKKGYKRKFLAEKMGVSQNQFSNWVTGRSHPPVEKAFKLSRLLGVTVEDLYEWEGDKK
ncbi:helix-turn-helix transcriptional regulator [Alkalihalobacillus sp. AL-G]|uniref:helix-turn-helix transcriptional regulator n=1 Tax=Alkalihalobacillus sp. AL-G TaxID=2926399 RepID=UPI00272A7C7B|nr:helix-turn-helix transcriptional regulator [Alkalihalobacillus sp. AL-G]WLD92706.1 helix-turn-helix domain-containing protein [Alkalihalobacillus sp. AL-G]